MVMLMANYLAHDTYDWICASKCDDTTRADILAEAQFILGNASFQYSRRCVTLFRHLVACFLEDHQKFERACFRRCRVWKESRLRLKLGPDSIHLQQIKSECA